MFSIVKVIFLCGNMHYIVILLACLTEMFAIVWSVIVLCVCLRAVLEG